MSDEERGDGDIERYSRERPDSTSKRENKLSTGNRKKNNPQRRDSTDAETLTDAVSGRLSRTDAVTVYSDSVQATLVGLPTVDIEEFVYSHQTDGSGEYVVALFDVKNTTDSPLKWQSTRTKFIGDDEYTYKPARLTLDPAQLGPGCHTRQVELPPGQRARIVTLVEELPPRVDIVEVTHSLQPPSGFEGRERLVFSV
ncbi:hypothetical protein ACFQJ7_12955 [Halovenus rubra]|uniref:DUF4352 domain-containing protein n=2 Tax=Halovenus rubra TaxID=869890 RepID=A0ABD5X6U9_9EURY|nr:hypothetical protein [Halovenus rubra]